MKTIITICILKFLTGLFNKTKNKNKIFFLSVAYSVLVVKKF